VGQVPELLVSNAAEGATVVTRLHAWPEASWQGKLDYIAPALDAQTHTLPVRMTLKNPEGKLKAGMFGTLELLGDEERPLTVPAAAVLVVDGAHTVFVPEEADPGHFKPVGVEIGRRAGDLVEIKRGLTAGQKVVTQGAFTLKSLLKQDELGEGHAH
jgi:RND family efflux transporter MFP subunit